MIHQLYGDFFFFFWEWIGLWWVPIIKDNKVLEFSSLNIIGAFKKNMRIFFFFWI